ATAPWDRARDRRIVFVAQVTLSRGARPHSVLPVNLNVIWLITLLGVVAMALAPGAESPTQGTAALETMLRIPASHFQNKSAGQLSIDLRRGIGPDDAATIALYSNPALRAIRDRRGLASAQLIQAGILPNPI